jgi:hypothetical protein
MSSHDLPKTTLSCTRLRAIVNESEPSTGRRNLGSLAVPPTRKTSAHPSTICCTATIGCWPVDIKLHEFNSTHNSGEKVLIVCCMPAIAAGSAPSISTLMRSIAAIPSWLHVQKPENQSFVTRRRWWDPRIGFLQHQILRLRNRTQKLQRILQPRRDHRLQDGVVLPMAAHFSQGYV